MALLQQDRNICISSALAILLAILAQGNSANLRSDGGYDLVFAVEEGSVLAQVDQERYIQNVKVRKIFSHNLNS
jgi:hypothetical protein